MTDVVPDEKPVAAEAEGIELLGSEMLTWSDFDGESGPFGGRLAARLLEVPAGTGRVLVAGPHAATVVADIHAQGHPVDVLLRSWPDAQRLRAELPDDVGIFCGPLSRFRGTEGGYAVVVAVAGLDRLPSAEDERPRWRDVLDRLISLLADGGELLVGVANEVGIDRLLSLAPQARHHDADWPEGRVDLEASPSVDAVRDHLAGRDGLREVRGWACHGGRAAPALAAPTDVLAGATDDQLVRRLIGSAYADPRHPMLKDPVTTAADLTRAGLAAATAPLTVLHLRAGEPTEPGPVKSVLLVEELGDDPLTLRYTRSESGWQREVLDGRTTTHGAVTRDPSRLAGAVPDVATLAEELETACAANDMTYASGLVRAYRSWLRPDDDGQVPPERVALGFPDLSFNAGTVGVLDGSRVAAEAASVDTVLVRALLDATASLLVRGIRHPWEESVTPRAAAATLAAATDLEVSDADLDAAVSLDTELRGGPAPWDHAAALGGRAAPTYAELAEQVEQLVERATAADQHIIWLLKHIQARQRAVRRLRGLVRRMEHSREMRVGRRVFWVREELKQRRQRKADAERPPGEWRDPAEVAAAAAAKAKKPVDPDAAAQIERDLIPPGARPSPEEIEPIDPLGPYPKRTLRNRLRGR